LLDINFGKQTSDRKEIIDKTLEYMREDVVLGERKRYDILIKRTRIIILGKETVRRTRGTRTIFSVPILLECRSEDDKAELESILRVAGYYVCEGSEGGGQEVRVQGGQELHQDKTGRTGRQDTD
jgi:hypothetical protein